MKTTSAIVFLLVQSTTAILLEKKTGYIGNSVGLVKDPHFNRDPFHPVLEDPLWPEHVKNLKAVAGPSVTDQIGASVANSANEGSDPNPMNPKRNIIGGDPTSFTPNYNDTTGSKSAGDIAEAEAEAKGKAINEAAEAKAKKEAEEAKAAKEKADIKQDKIDADKLAEEPTTVAEVEAKAALVKKVAAKKEAKKTDTAKEGSKSEKAAKKDAVEKAAAF